MATRGRKPTAAAAAEVIELDDDKVKGAMVAMRDQAQEDLIELVELAGGVQAHQAFELVKNFSSAAQIQLFKRIRESKRIKDLPIRSLTGEVKKFDSIKDACPELFGRTYQSMLDAEERLGLLGEAAYDTASRLRLNSASLRAARALPPEQLETVRLAIANGTSKAEILSVIEDLALKAEEAATEVTEAKAELEAKDQLLTEKNKRIDQLKAAQKKIDRLPPDEQLALLQREATSIMNDALGAIRGGLRQALISLANQGDERSTPFMAGLVGQLQADLSALREEFQLPDVSDAEGLALAGEVAQWAKP